MMLARLSELVSQLSLYSSLESLPNDVMIRDGAMLGPNWALARPAQPKYNRETGPGKQVMCVISYPGPPWPAQHSELRHWL